MYVYHHKENKWIATKPESGEKLKKIFNETREERHYIEVSLKEMKDKICILEVMNDCEIYIEDIINALITLAKHNTLTPFPASLVNASQVSLSQDEIKGSLIDAMSEIDKGTLHPPTLDNIISHMPDEVNVLSWEGEESELETDTDENFDADEEDAVSEIEEVSTVNIAQVKEAFLEVVNTLKKQDSLVVTIEKYKDLKKAHSKLLLEGIGNQLKTDETLKKIQGPTGGDGVIINRR